MQLLQLLSSTGLSNCRWVIDLSMHGPEGQVLSIGPGPDPKPDRTRKLSCLGWIGCVGFQVRI
ncbi:hypothetical protein SAY87_008636 [Trapa incisa]|uniref:Uncharacterized protein n=1 Tax=Trapa incisa TaxID=236973 RepID=A0AAN7PW68_9MYRT|nr:hypothetical protein SAY87_008636 [Trapa incisa]